MYHLVAHAIDDKPLFTDWEAGRALWDDLVRHLHGVVALLLMPDHVHAVTLSDQVAALVEAARAFSRWRGWHRGDPGRLWEPIPAAEAVRDRQKQRRLVRYVHLNPCRAGLVHCPLAWPLSTYRDRLGLSAHPLVGLARDPVAFHAVTSADGSTRVQGTPFPTGELEPGGIPLARLASAVSEWRRVPLGRLLVKPGERQWLLAAARELSGRSLRAIAAAFGVSHAAVGRAPRLHPSVAGALARLAADPRAPGLLDDDPRLVGWRPRGLRLPSLVRASSLR